LTALWRREAMPFALLIAEVKAAQPWGEATIKTLLTRLMRKGLVTAAREDGRHLYRPAITREQLVESEIRRLAARLYDGKIEALISDLTKLDKKDARPSVS
jgi:BlaI family transcriptional regulator, penicillinase repressor